MRPTQRDKNKKLKDLFKECQSSNSAPYTISVICSYEYGLGEAFFST
jgi:hypothetical protein